MKAETITKLAAARLEISRLCAGRHRRASDGQLGREWTMSIPYQADDSDAVLVQAFDALLAELKEIETSHRAVLMSIRQKIEAAKPNSSGATLLGLGTINGLDAALDIVVAHIKAIDTASPAASSSTTIQESA